MLRLSCYALGNVWLYYQKVVGSEGLELWDGYIPNEYEDMLLTADTVYFLRCTNTVEEAH